MTGAAADTAGTATALATSRTINGTSFDGSANVTVTAAASTLTGATLASGVTASSLTSFGASIALGTPASGVLTNATGLPVAGGGGVGGYGLVIERGARLIITQNVDQRPGVRGRFDLRDIEFAELFNIFKNLIELSLKQRSFLVGQLNPREIGDIRHIHMICI